MTIELEKELARDLISSKIRHIQQLIEEIMNKWNEKSINDFLNKAETGIYREAENDAIDLKQLLHEEKKLRKLFESYF